MMKKLFLLSIFLSASLFAQTTYIVYDGQVVNSTFLLPNFGDILIVERGGLIDVNGIGVQMQNNNQTTLNKGVISTTGNNSYGIFNNDGDNVVITNKGSISTSGLTTHGIYNNGGDNAVITNKGSISTSGAFADGIHNSGGDNVLIINKGSISTSTSTSSADGISNYNSNNAVIINKGSISTSGAFAYGINHFNSDNAVTINKGSISTSEEFAYGIRNRNSNNAEITNNGSISTSGSDAYGISNFNSDNAVIINKGSISTSEEFAYGISNFNSDNAVIINKGSISTSGESAWGIFNDISDNVVITNKGSISTSGESAYGIYDFNNSTNTHIINSGTIKSAQASALQLEGTNTTLTLLAGSNIQGAVVITNDVLNLNVRKGLNLDLTIVGDFGDLDIDNPFVLDGSRIVVVDRTGFALQGDVTADISDTILGNIYRHRLDLACPCDCDPCSCEAWVQGLGAYSDRDKNKVYGYDDWQAGFLAGASKCVCDGYGSVFGGVLFGEAEVDKHSQTADTTTYIGGVAYEKIFCNTFIGTALALGYIDWENKRYVMNNLAEGGIEKAKADTGGVFVTPEITLAYRLENECFCPIVSATFRYAGLFLDGYKEKGSSSNLKVDDRNIQLLTTRCEVAIPYDWCYWCLEPYIGGFARYQVSGNDIDAELLDQTLDFNSGSHRKLVSFLFGVRGNTSLSKCDLFFNIEGDFDNNKGSRVLGEAGIAFCF